MNEKSKVNKLIKFLPLLITFIFLLLITACSETEVKEEDLTEFKKFEWMLGIWEGKQGEAETYESWRRKNFRILEGISYTTIDNQRVYSQDMRIEQSNNKIYYIIQKSTYTDKEIKLELTEVSDSTVQFTNSEVGFPEKIIYSRLKNKRMNVTLSGEEEDENNRTEFNYKQTEDF